MPENKLNQIAAQRKLRTILLASGNRRPRSVDQASEFRPVIEKYFEIVDEDFDFTLDPAALGADFAIVFGGDGSILRSAKLMGTSQIPVLGVNLGTLGFLADVNPKAIEAALQAIRVGELSLTDHLMIDVQLFRDGEEIARQTGLNEMAILGGPPFDIQKIELFVDGESATVYNCDGLIVSTPVGSTAHNLSAGGPILRNDLQALVIAPISPHTLTVRPVVDSADRIYELVVAEPNGSACVVVDGKVLSPLQSTDRVRISRAKSVFQLISVTGNNYYRTLREKLGWAGQFQKAKSGD